MDEYLDCAADATRIECGPGAAAYEKKAVGLEVGPLLESIGCGKLSKLKMEIRIVAYPSVVS